MNLLLDTHTLIWFAEKNNHLSKKAKTTIESSGQVYVSIVSFWEIAIKLKLKKLAINYPLKKLIQETEKNNIQILSLHPSHILTLEKLPLHHRDPFDRIIIAQSIKEKLPVVSKDENFDDYKIKRVW